MVIFIQISVVKIWSAELCVEFDSGSNKEYVLKIRKAYRNPLQTHNTQ